MTTATLDHDVHVRRTPGIDAIAPGRGHDPNRAGPDVVSDR